MPNTITDPTCQRVQKYRGTKFGKLTASAFIRMDPKVGQIWEFVCECGKLVVRPIALIKSGHASSCGCLRIERLTARSTTHGFCLHRQRNRTYSSWANMIQRCENPKNPDFSYYGGRGIKVCGRWKSFQRFFEDMGQRPVKTTLERVDNNGNYHPKNCIWASRIVQGSNMRSCRLLTHNGKTLTVAAWARELRVSRWMLYTRLRSGWPVDRILTSPGGKR